MGVWQGWSVQAYDPLRILLFKNSYPNGSGVEGGSGGDTAVLPCAEGAVYEPSLTLQQLQGVSRRPPVSPDEGQGRKNGRECALPSKRLLPL